MSEFLNLVASGLALGGVYAVMALALVMIYQATQLVNFAQGEMAMFSTYLAWKLMDLGWPYWRAFAVTVLASFLGGVVIERVVVRPFANAPVLASVIVGCAPPGWTSPSCHCCRTPKSRARRSRAAT